MNICVYGAASDLIHPEFIKSGEALGEALALNGHSIVFGGGAEGMMGAVARGAERHNGYILGISPSFFKVDGVLFDRCSEFIYTETMRERKQLLEEKSDGFIVTPGGIGTFDEFFEILALRQLRRHDKPILLYNIRGYFDPIIEMIHSAAQQKFMKEKNLSLFGIADTPQKAIEYFENYSCVNGKIEEYR